MPNSRTLFLDACGRKKTARPPVWLMRQAGRHLPEYRELRARHHFLEMLADEKLIAEISLQPWRRYRMDGVIVFSDILLIPSVCGMELKFLEGQGPKFSKPIAAGDDLKMLKELEPKKDVPFLLNALRALREEIKDNAALIGFAGSPWTVASYICADAAGWRKREPASFKKVLDWVARQTIIYLTAQMKAGVDLLQIFDSWGGVLSEAEYREWSAPFIRQIVEGLPRPKPPVILYVRDSAPLLAPMRETGCDILSVGWETDLTEARTAVGEKFGLQGNLNPHILFQATPEEIRRETENMLKRMEGFGGYIANLGHGVLPKTPVENVAAFVETVQKI